MPQNPIVRGCWLFWALACGPRGGSPGAKVPCGVGRPCPEPVLGEAPLGPSSDPLSLRRLVVEPQAMAFVGRGGGEGAPVGGAVPFRITLGRAGEGNGALLLRFAPELPPKARVQAAYLLLQTDLPLASAEPVVLRLVRVKGAWSDGYRSPWFSVPLSREGSPGVRVGPGSPHLVRIDARGLVEGVRGPDVHDLGFALVAESQSPLGVEVYPYRSTEPSFVPSEPPAWVRGAPRVATGPNAMSPSNGFPGTEPRWRWAPRLEIYYK